MEWGSLILFLVGGAFVVWWHRPPRCKECWRVLGPPSDAELTGGEVIGCKRCNLNLRETPFGWFDKDWNPCAPPPVEDKP